MVKIITGKRGTGKTTILIDRINETMKETQGDVVCVENGSKLRYDISYKVRLVDATRFYIESYASFYGLIAGMLASNFDISDIFVDGILRICGRDYEKLGETLDALDKLMSTDANIVLTVSADDNELPENVLKYKV